VPPQAIRKAKIKKTAMAAAAHDRAGGTFLGFEANPV
jgi:hypothetical protein